MKMNEESVFAEALAKGDPRERAAFLDQACTGDPALRESVESLLAAYEAGSFLETPAVERPGNERKDEASGSGTQAEPPIDTNETVSLEFLSPSAKTDALGRLGHYDVLEVIGKGGMGIVLRGFDEQLHRVVAIKVMAAQLATNATARKRFAREAQAQAAVSHDHIVTIHAVEADSPLPYLVMQYVAGLSLQQRLDKDGPLELQEILRIGMQTASGLAAAHAQGLVHRDIKPANILLENGVERVKVADFGLARAATEASLTQSGAVAGTPQYMSPEQAEGIAIDQRTDLFSLGSVMYAMCTGRAPFRASGTIAVLKRVCEETPTPIRETNPEIPDWLVAIIDKLHAKDPAERYQSAIEVAELLGRHLAHVQHPSVAPLPPLSPLGRGAGGEGRPQAATSTPFEDSGRATRRQRLAVAAAILLCLVGGLSLTEATGVTNLRATVIRIFTPDGTLVVEVDDPGVKVTIEGDGGIVITGAGLQEVRLKPGSYKVQAAKDGKPVRLDQELVTITRGDKQVVRVRLDPAVPTAAAGQTEPLAPGEIRRFVGHTAGINSLALSRDGRLLLSGSRDKTLRLWDMATGKEIRRFVGHTGFVVGATLSPDGRRALSTGADSDRRIRLWDVETGKELPFWELNAGHALVWSPDGRRLLFSDGTKIRLCEVETGKELRRFEGHTADVDSLAFSPDGRHILSGSNDKTMRLWEMETGKELRRFEGHNDLVRSVAFSADGRNALSGGADGTMRRWEVDSGKELRRFKHGSGWVHGVAFSPDGRSALSTGHPVRLWDVQTGKVLGCFAGHTSVVAAVVFTPDGRHALSAGWDGDGSIRMWELPTGSERGEFAVLGGKGVAERKFDTLAEAVQGASDGDTIEVRGNGPFVIEPINIRKSALTIRAGPGFRPIIRLNAESETGPFSLQSDAPLLLEGLELQREPQGSPKAASWRAIISSNNAPLYAANCRFLLKGLHTCIWAHSPIVELRNCEFLCTGGSGAFGGHCVAGQRWHIENCVQTEGSCDFNYVTADLNKVSIRVIRNTRVCINGFGLNLFGEASPLLKGAGEPPVRVEASGNVFDTRHYHLSFDQSQPKPLAAAEAEAALRRLLAWQGHGNLYATDQAFLGFSVQWKVLEPGTSVKSLADWKRFWGGAEVDPLEGRVRYQGGNLLTKLHASPEKLTPEDFRLRPDSAGYKAGKDGKDLGADVDLVGPGPAYERWKKTPEYQQWLKDTKQITKAEAPKAEPKAFVVLTGKGVEVRKFDTLAEAVQGASDGDAIEIRGNGPFVTKPVTIENSALTIRAGEGFRPVLRIVPEKPNDNLVSTSRPLVLEGLEIRDVNKDRHPSGFYSILASGKPLYLANCRLLQEKPLRDWLGLIGAYSTIQMRNCELYGGGAAIASFHNHVPIHFVMDNCLGSGNGPVTSLNYIGGPNNVSLTFNRNTITLPWGCEVDFIMDLDRPLAGAGAAKPIRFEASSNVFDMSASMLLFEQREPSRAKAKWRELKDPAVVFLPLVSWRGQGNVYRPGASSLKLRGADGQDVPFGPTDRMGWDRFWGQTKTESAEGRVRYSGGDLFSRGRDAPEKLTPEDFRLRPDSAGYRAGKDGKDLGADVDLVGPGPAYERWKKTPEYQRWLKDTKQVK